MDLIAETAFVYAQMLRDVERDAAIASVVEAAHSVATVAARPCAPMFRHRRGRGVSKSAKRRYYARVGRWAASVAAHAQAARAWLALSSAVGAITLGGAP